VKLRETKNLNMADTDVAFNEDRGLGQPGASSAVPAAGAHTEQPERELKPGNSNLTGGAPAGPKKGLVDKVKDLFDGVKKGRHNNTGSAVGSGVGYSPDSSPYGTAADNQGFSGRALDPTAAPAGNNFRQQGAGSPGPWPHPTNPRHSHGQGGATLTGEHSNLYPGPQDDGVKKEGFLSKIKDKLHSPRSPRSPTSNQ
jgi:hypothetical protein